MSDLNQQSPLELPILQDPEYLEALESCDLIALLRLNSSDNASATHRPIYTTCGSNSLKRRSPSSSSSLPDSTPSAATFSEPRPKKLFVEQDPCDLRGVSKISLPALLHAQSYPVLRRCDSDPTKPPVPVPVPPQSPEASSPKGHFVEQEDCHLSGFSKISLPTSIGIQTHAQSIPVLRRSVSDLAPINPPPAVPRSPDQNLKMGANPETPSPKKWSGSGSTLPPLPPSLRRTVSDLTAFRTPPKVSACPKSSDSFEEGGSDSRRLKRMRDHLAVMGQWCNEVAQEEEEEDEDANAGSEDGNNNMTKDVPEADPEELVSVERVGECFTVQFKCPCGKGYQILLTGNSCYYKLM